MAIEKIHIKNFKSLANVTIETPNPFTVFVGPNASGKSNIFEALDFYSYLSRIDVNQLVNLFGGFDSIMNNESDSLQIKILFPELQTELLVPKRNGKGWKIIGVENQRSFNNNDNSRKFQDSFIKGEFFGQFFYNFSRIFIDKKDKVVFRNRDNKKLSLDAENLTKVLRRILIENEYRTELIDLLSFLIPEFEKIEIKSDELTGDESLLIYEKHTNKPFPRHLISDGTFNIIALITAVFQSKESQFLCIEEPENGIHPEAIKELVGFFREQCEEKGHYIWLTTHSQSLVSELKPEEIIVVDKIEGETRIKQFQGEEFYSLSMDDAWLSNVLGGGLL
jgi:predicted ATPase